VLAFRSLERVPIKMGLPLTAAAAAHRSPLPLPLPLPPESRRINKQTERVRPLTDWHRAASWAEFS
jgi:hypothetical protein